MTILIILFIIKLLRKGMDNATIEARVLEKFPLVSNDERELKKTIHDLRRTTGFVAE